MTPADLERMALERGGKITRVNLPASAPTDGCSEEEFQQWVTDRAKERGWKVYHTRDSRRSESGFPDLILCRGSIIAAELKVKGRKRTKNQESWANAWIEA